MVLPRKINSRTSMRSFLIRRLTTVVLMMMVFMVGYLILSDVTAGDDNSDAKKDNYKSPHELLAKRRQLESQNQGLHERRDRLMNKIRGWCGRIGRGGRDDDHVGGEKKIIEVDLNDKSPDSPLQKLLSGKVHLIEINPGRGRSMTDENSYAGIDATFCQIDFAQQKRDPSSAPM